MSVCIDIDDRGLGTIGIADADGEINAYRLRLVPRGLGLWAVELVRTDTQASYAVRVFNGNRWECSCPAFQYRKRGQSCKHVEAMTAFRAWLNEFMQPCREPVGNVPAHGQTA